MTELSWPELDDWEQPREEADRAAFNTHCLEQIRKLKRNPNMKMSETFQSRWLHAGDLQGREVNVVIGSVTMEQFADGSSKPVVWFQNKDKGLVLNKTNGTHIASMYGDDTVNWSGKPLTLFSMQVQGPQGMTQGIRLRFPDGTASGPAAPAQQPAPQADFDDDILF